MKTALLATAALVLAVSVAHAGPYAASGPWPVGPNGPLVQQGPFVPPPSVTTVRPFPQRYSRGLFRNDDDGSPILDSEEHTGLGDRTTQRCVFCGGVGH